MKTEFKTWSTLVWYDPLIPLRDPGSKHQKKVSEILMKLQAAKENPDNIQALRDIMHIACPRSGIGVVAYCRYLQYCLDILKNEGGEE